MLTGESLFITTFTNAGRRPRRSSRSPRPTRARSSPMHLDQLGGELICQKDSFLCAAKRRADRHRLPEEDRRRPLRRRGLHHAAAHRRRHRPGPRRRHPHRAHARARRDAASSTPAASSPSCRASTTTSSSSAASRTRSSAARACSSPPSPAPATCGCSRCPFSRLAGRVLANATGTTRGKDEGQRPRRHRGHRAGVDPGRQGLTWKKKGDADRWRLADWSRLMTSYATKVQWIGRSPRAYPAGNACRRRAPPFAPTRDVEGALPAAAMAREKDGPDATLSNNIERRSRPSRVRAAAGTASGWGGVSDVRRVPHLRVRAGRTVAAAARPLPQVPFEHLAAVVQARRAADRPHGAAPP